jgi:hypothetical protein
MHVTHVVRDDTTTNRTHVPFCANHFSH